MKINKKREIVMISALALVFVIAVAGREKVPEETRDTLAAEAIEIQPEKPEAPEDVSGVTKEDPVKADEKNPEAETEVKSGENIVVSNSTNSMGAFTPDAGGGVAPAPALVSGENAGGDTAASPPDHGQYLGEAWFCKCGARLGSDGEAAGHMSAMQDEWLRAHFGEGTQDPAHSNYGNIGLYKGVNDTWNDAQLYQDLAAHVGW